MGAVFQRAQRVVGAWVAAAWLGVAAGCAEGDAPAPARDAPPSASASASGTWGEEDWSVFERKARWALAERLDTLALGEAMSRLGRTFVGTPYVPGTLEAEGEERLVVNFRGLDCVTFVENVATLARFAQLPNAAALLADRGAAENRYEDLLTELRYRDGRIAGYPSRLHYFSDWIGDNEARGLVRNITRDVGGVHDATPIDFMTTHLEAYRQLADTSLLARVREAEARLSGAGRWYVPEGSIADVESSIREGDIIAATSTVPGLDVAHTGLAVRIDGRLHLLHAPLVGEAVEISERPLADRIRAIEGQDGIMIARPSAGR